MTAHADYYYYKQRAQSFSYASGGTYRTAVLSSGTGPQVGVICWPDICWPCQQQALLFAKPLFLHSSERQRWTVPSCTACHKSLCFLRTNYKLHEKHLTNKRIAQGLCSKSSPSSHHRPLHHGAQRCMRHNGVTLVSARRSVSQGSFSMICLSFYSKIIRSRMSFVQREGDGKLSAKRVS
jgi:hypothetical protein